MRLTETEIAWLAGILEGEATFLIPNHRHNGVLRFKAIRITIFMTDEDVMKRIARLVSFERPLYNRPPQTPTAKPAFGLSIGGDKAAEIMKKILPYMGERRSKKIMECLRQQRINKVNRIRRDENWKIAGIRNQFKLGQSNWAKRRQNENQPKLF